MIKNFFNVAGADAVKRIAEWIKHKFYTKTEIDDMLSAGMRYEVVEELPATGEAGTVYLVPKQSAGTGDVYDEYIYVDGSFEHIGSTEIDLSNYYTKTEADNLLGDKVDKESGKGLSTEDFTTAEKTKLGGIETGAKVNVQSDWNQSDNTKDDFIKNKPTLRQPSADGTAGQYLKSNGNGNAPSWETMDSAPTANSTKAVTSGGVKTALDGKQASVTITTNANTPTDNDTVIMQDSGNTGTTSFLRRKLSTLWEYFKIKPYGEAYLVWGGKNHNANLSPIDANLISEARANRLARYPLQYMKIEDSRDDGVTWTENTSITDSAKHILVTDCAGNASNIRIGGSDANHVADEHCKTRITFTTYTGSSSVLYARIEKICLWIATGGTTGNTCTVLGRLQKDVEDDNDVWATLGGPATLGGWSDWNVIQTDFTTYGNQKATQYGQFRLLFECTGRASGSTNIGLTIQKIRAYGMRCWEGKNSLALYNSFFSVDSSDNATFPANVTASKHITSGGTTNQMVAGNGDLKDIAETCKTAVSLNGGKSGFRILKIDGADYTYLLVLADVTGVYDGTITNKKYGIQGFIFMQRDGSDTYKSLVGRVTATASYSSSYVYLYTDVVQSDVVKPCVIKKDGRWLLCLSARGNNGAYYATSIIFFGRTYELADEPFTKIRVDSTFTHYYDGGAEIEYIKQASRYPLWASFGGNNTQFVLGDGTLQNSPIPVSKGGTGATTAIGAEYNILNQVADISTTLSDTRKIALCNQTKSASNGVFRWIALSNVWTWIKTHFDSSPTSGSSNGITSGGVYSALEEKVNLQPDFTASQIDYSAGNVGKWQKVLRFPEGADLVINMKKTAMGSDTTSTLWFSSSSMGDSYTSLFGNHSVRFVHDGGYVFLVLACRKSTYEPIESYTFQIAHSSVPMSDIVAVTDASPITATPKEPNIVYRAPMTTGAVSFNVNSSGSGSVSMANHNDFLGNMTSEAINGVVVTMSGATEGQIYRFVFTRNITGGVTFKQSNVAYCTISGDVNAGDTITLTAVSNTADGWLYEQESAGIESSDGSNIVEYNGSTADVRVNWEKLPARVVMNVADDDYEDDKNIAIGYGASTYKLTGDENYPYAYTTKATFEKMKVDGGAEEYTHAVTAGTTYSIVRGSVTTSFTPVYSGYAVILNAGSVVALDTQFLSTVFGRNFSGLYALYDATTSGTNQYIIAVISLNSSSADNIDSNSFATVWVKASSITPNVAIGNNAKANGSSSTAIGNGASSYGYYCTSLGNSARAVGGSAVAVGANSRADGVGSTAIGRSASSSGLYSSAFGNGAQATGTYSVALGDASYANGSGSFACGNNAVAYNSNAIALGLNAVDYDMYGIAIGYASGVGGLSEDTNRPYLTAKRFNGVSFNNGTADVYTAYLYNGVDITITLNGASYALTSPSTYPRMLIVVNDSDAQYIYRSLTTCLEMDGEFVSTGGNPHTSNATVENLAGNYYAVWLPYNHSSPYVATESVTLFATITSVGSNHNGIAIGNGSKALHDNAFAFGNFLRTLGKIQTVVGSNNKPVEGYFVVGNGTTDSTGRRNCLVIDISERMVINGGYVGGTQEINMTQQTGVMSNITKSVYRIKWNGTGTVTLTLQAGGCVEGQRVTIYAETNDVHISGCTNVIPQGRFADFLFVNGAWRPMVGY